MNQLRYVVPQSLKEAVALLSEYREKAGILAGGTDLLDRIKKGTETHEVLVNIKYLRDLNYITYDARDGLRIGAVTPLSAIETSAVIQKNFPVLAQTAGMMASPVVRNQATIGGNLGNAAPSADIAPALLVLAANIKIVAINEEKPVAVEDFFTGPGQTILRPGQLIAEIQVPRLPPRSGATYIKQKRREGADLAVAGVAVLATMADDITLGDVRIVLGAVAPIPIRAKRAENILRGKKVTDGLLAEAGKVASDEARPIDDVRSSAEYRKKLVAVLVPRAIRQAIELAAVRVK